MGMSIGVCLRGWVSMHNGEVEISLFEMNPFRSYIKYYKSINGLNATHLLLFFLYKFTILNDVAFCAISYTRNKI